MKNIVIGTTFIDIKGFPDSDFMANGRNAGHTEYVHGGVGRNIAENLSRCGQETTFISGVDESPFAGDILGRLQDQGIDTEYVIRKEKAMGTWLAVFNNEGDVAASISTRPELAEIAGLLDREEAGIFNDAGSISVEIDMDPEILERTFYYADKYHIPVFGVVSNMKIALEKKALNNKLFCLVCNKQEAGLILKADLTNLSPEDLIQKIKEDMSIFPIEKLVVTMGDKGAVYFDRLTKRGGWIPAVPAKVCDTTGAGDAFFSGMVIGLTQEKSLKEACRIGALLASSVIESKENVCPRMILPA